MKNTFFIIYSICVAISFFSCVPNTETQITDVKISLADPDMQKLLDAKDQQDISSLYKYFKHKNPAFRYQSVMAFASLKNEAAVDSILPMLQDPILEVRAAAAFALGQCGNEKITDRLVAAFAGKDTLEVDNIFNANILEAVGKLGSISDLKSLATVKTYRSTDSLLLLGQARAIYRMSMRNIVSDEGTSRMIDLLYLPSTPLKTKLIAAYYLAKAKDINLSLAKVRMTEMFNRELNPEIKMSLAIAMGNTKDLDYIPVLKTGLIAGSDYRVKCNIIRALGQFPYLDVRDVLLQNVRNENIQIAETAASVLQKIGIIEDVLEYMRLDTVNVAWQVRSKMNNAVLSHTALYFTKSKEAFTERIKNNIKSAENEYAKAAYIKALSGDPYNYLLLIQLYASEKEQMHKLAAIEGLGEILRNPLFFKAFGNGYGKVKAEILNTLVEAISSKDVGQIAVAADIIQDPTLQWKEWLKDLTFMKDALGKHVLPREIESYNELLSCISYLQDSTFKAEKPTFNHPIDWSILQTLSDSSVAAIKTTKGLIRVKLYKNKAPGSVANFVSLIEKKFYSGKLFHRVVPNFVIQTGCPRGDGYGSMDYTIRSELPQLYYDGEGYLGMASAGNDTESTQWFITVSQAPHLSGNYTIFGKVIEGMDVVHKIQVGDKINEIILVR